MKVQIANVTGTIQSTLLGLGVVLLVGISCQESKVYQNKEADVESRIESLLSEMTLEEKAKLTGGTDYWNTNAIARLGIPSLKSMNGPYGVRPYFKTPEYPAGVPDSIKATVFPVNVAMAASWNPELVRQAAVAMAKETKLKEHHILLAPCINIQRVPYGGRNFESFSEDPYLTSRMAVAYVEGVQSENVIPTVKHYAANNTELDRFNANMTIDEQTLHEIYLPAFKASVEEANAMGFMSAFVKVNDEFASHSRYLLTELLKEKWGFQGFVMSDWGAVHSTVEAANGGLDIEMPSPKYFENLVEAVKNGEVEESVIDDKVRRVLRPMIQFGYYDNPIPMVDIDMNAQQELSEKLAAESIVLLKNKGGLLPLNTNKIKSIAVIGPNADVSRLGGNGSSVVIPFDDITTLEGIRELAPEGIKVQYATGVYRKEDIAPIPASCFKTVNGEQGLTTEYFNNHQLSGSPVKTLISGQVNNDWVDRQPFPVVKADSFSVRWTGQFTPEESGEFELCLGSNDASQLFVNDELFVDNSGKHGFGIKRKKITLKQGESLNVKVEYADFEGKAGLVLGIRPYLADPIQDAVDVAASADVAILCLGFSSADETEGGDLKSIMLPADQRELADRVLKANPNTIVILNSGTSLFIKDLVSRVPALLESWYPGQEGGRAIAKTLFGQNNPSGKLPQSWAKTWKDVSAFGWYPEPKELDSESTNIDDNTSEAGGEGAHLTYGEGIFVGYRHMDKEAIEPMFPFGFGLSYTQFELSDLAINKEDDGGFAINLNVTNAGDFDGAEVVQIYVKNESIPNRPEKELKAFQKVFVKAGESQQVTIKLHAEAFSHYDTSIHDWKEGSGNFKIMIGTSSRNIWKQQQVSL